ncbi:hypothetical protein IMZ11_35625 [Microtetraspora sp. AC03309]|nr:hypothetical protein [Microtetraspora sp. AC03309]MCC5580958.1 hypothetical protein [Microtetraspora sp. AC03309]
MMSDSAFVPSDPTAPIPANSTIGPGSTTARGTSAPARASFHVSSTLPTK